MTAYGTGYYGTFYYGGSSGPFGPLSRRTRRRVPSISSVLMAKPGYWGVRDVDVGNLSLGWRANGTSRASCHMRARDAHLMGFDTLLGLWMWVNTPCGPWGGFVEDTPSEIGGGVLELSFVDMAGLLDLMTTPRTYQQTSSTPGALMARAIRDGGVETQWIRFTIVGEDGAPVTVEWRGDKVLSVVQSLAGKGGGLWSVDVGADRSITFTYNTIPVDRRGSVLLIEGREVIAGSIRPSISQLVNDIVGVASDRDWQRAASARVWSEASIRDYGRRQQTIRYEGQTTRSSLASVASIDLATLSQPAGPVSLEVLASHPIAAELRVRYLVRLWSHTQNRQYDLTILGLAYDTTRGTIVVTGNAVEAG